MIFRRALGGRGFCSVFTGALLLGLLPGLATAEAVMTGDLPRGADLGFLTSTADGQLVVRRLREDSAAAQAGLREYDVILQINGEPVSVAYVGQDRLRRLDGDERVELSITRENRERTVRFTPPPRPLESLEGVTSTYGVVETPDGARLRSIVTVPDDTSGRLPAIFFTQWVSCDGVDLLGSGPTAEVMRAVATRARAVLLRVERSSGGDSEGPGCHDLDYETELAHYRHAYGVLVRHPRVDPDRVVVWGSSLGSTVAPLLAAEEDVAGVMVGGAGAVTYLERMINFDRIGMERGGMDPAEIHDRMLEHIRFQVYYLVDGMTPEAIAEAHPDLADVWPAIRGSGNGVHYGRPYAWHQQAARRNFLAAWAQIEAPVLVVFNEFDQFEMRHGHALIAETVNRLRPGTATYVEQANVGHSHSAYATADDAIRWNRAQPVPELTAGRILGWLESELGVARR